MEAFDSFFAKGGSKTLKVFYQEGEAPGIGKFLAILIQGDMIVPFIINFFLMFPRIKSGFTCS